MGLFSRFWFEGRVGSRLASRAVTRVVSLTRRTARH
jgi:hypothetical protein